MPAVGRSLSLLTLLYLLLSCLKKTFALFCKIIVYVFLTRDAYRVGIQVVGTVVVAECCLSCFCWQIGQGPQVVHDPGAALLGSDGLPLTLKS